MKHYHYYQTHSITKATRQGGFSVLYEAATAAAAKSAAGFSCRNESGYH